MRNLPVGHFLETKSSLTTSKRAKGCFVLDMSSATGAISELESMSPDYILQKSQPAFHKSSTWKFVPSWGEPSGPAGYQGHPALLVRFLCEAAVSGPQRQEAKGQACTMAFRVSLCLPEKATMNNGG